MKTNVPSKPYPNLLAFGLLTLGASLAFSQGSLTPPPGPPSPSMKTLEQIEPRTPIGSIPYTITSSGSYYVTTNLTTGAGTNGIIVAADHVTIDLSGFTLTGGGNLAGVLANSARQNIRIHNGLLQNWATAVNMQPANNCQVENLRLSVNGFFGLIGGHGWVVKNCTFTGLTGPNSQGANLLNGALVKDCAFLYHSGSGLFTGESAMVLNCNASTNAGIGITVGQGSTIKGCTTMGNGAGGLQFNANCRIVENNSCYNGLGMHAAVPGDNNRIDSNVFNHNRVVGARVDGIGNLFVRNQLNQNGPSGNNNTQFSFVGNRLGQTVTGTGAISSTATGWENFANP